MKKRLVQIAFYLLLFLLIFNNPISARVYTVFIAVYYDLNPSIFYKQIASESSFRSQAYSRVGAIGLGQIRKQTADYLEPNKPNHILLWIPIHNLKISAKYTKYLLKKYHGNYSLALAAYNWGESNVDKRLRKKRVIINPDNNYRYLFEDIYETNSFIKKILGH